MSVSIGIDNVVKKYGDMTIIPDLSAFIKNGEFFTLLGPSGCGKTTLLRMIAGFNSIEGGSIKFDGKVINDIPAQKRNIGMVFQSYAIFPHLTVRQNVEYGLKIRKVPKEHMKERVDEILKAVKIDEYQDRLPERLSGGQQQRVALARAIVIHPQVLLMDEPLSNLDAKLRESVRVELRQIQQKMGLSTIYVTHDQSEALSMSDSIVVLKDGIVHQVGTPQEIYFEPKTAFVADFIGTTNLISLKGESGNQVAYGGTVFTSSNPVKEGSEYVASVRPESAGLSKNPVENQVNLKAHITNTMFLGEKVRYFLRDALDKEWIVDAFDPGRTIHQGNVYVTFPAEKAWVIAK